MTLRKRLPDNGREAFAAPNAPTWARTEIILRALKQKHGVPTDGASDPLSFVEIQGASKRFFYVGCYVGRMIESLFYSMISMMIGGETGLRTSDVIR